MIKRSSTSAKAVWDLRVREATNELADQLVEDDHVPSAREIIYPVLKSMTLESWTNGLKAGRARARQQSDSSD